MNVVRTTIRIQDELYVRVKRFAGSTGRSVNAIIEDALRLYLRSGKVSRPKTPLRIIPFRGQATKPGVDLVRTSRHQESDDEERFSSRR